ncbi:MAG: ABC transporter ATP-binding protein [Anaerorhabdus sp.]|uniref:ABC transporter ATP-binding protein n=2 Tax=Anaerorhabdus sp. TaxID=1872524 RepID=UPI002FC82D11
MIKIQEVNKSYFMKSDSLHVLKNVSLEIEKGEYISILGKSGSGKTTLMNIIGCMDMLDDGSYFIDGIEIGSLSQDELASVRNEKIGFIFQKYHLIHTYTVLQNVMLPLLIRGVSRSEATQKAKTMLALVGLENREKHKPQELSGGQQQRVAIARALVTDPKILLADEPTGALDSKTGEEILELFKTLHQQGNTIIVITHDLKVAKQSEKIYTLEDGQFIDKIY